MPVLDKITFRGKREEMVRSKNIAAAMSDEDRALIGQVCLDGFKEDMQSRAGWEQTYAEAMKLTLQVMEAKSFPWPNCSNVKFPLLTIAALNFHARAYPALINGEAVVAYRPIGEDPDGVKAMRAQRVANHQNYQMLTATDWEEHEDKALIVTPIMGCSFKKTYFDHDKKTVVSRLVLPQNLVVPYYTASLDNCPRISERMFLRKNQFLTRVRRKHFLEVDYQPDTAPDATPTFVAKEQAQHVQANPTTTTTTYTPTEFIEQHCFIDLDGDGYEEPYVVTFIRATGTVVRIVARYTMSAVELNANKDVVFIEPEQYYLKKPFIPSPDGGFYDLGFGILLGPLNEAANSLINMLIDAGTMSILSGGFIGRGVKMKRGETTFKPYEWKPVDTVGGSVKDNIVPLPAREPSQALLDLLTFLVNYGERVAGANDVQLGELPGQNTKAQTMQIANANGQKIFAAIYKRWWRSSRLEFQARYDITATMIEELGPQGLAAAQEFKLEPADYQMPVAGIFPIADPNVASPEERQRLALMVRQMAMETPGQNVYKAQMRVYQAFNVPNPDEIFPDPQGEKAIPPQPNPKLIEAQTKQALAQLKQLEAQNKNRIAIADMLRKIEETSAKIDKLRADAAKAIAEAHGVETGHNIAQMQLAIQLEDNRRKGLLEALDLLREIMNEPTDATDATGALAGGASLPNMAGGPGNGKVSSIPA